MTSCSTETHSTCGPDREGITTTSSIHTEAWWKLGGIKTFCWRSGIIATVVPVADGRDGGHSQVLQLDDFLLLLIRHRSSWCCRKTIGCCGYCDGFWTCWGISNLLLLHDIVFNFLQAAVCDIRDCVYLHFFYGFIDQNTGLIFILKYIQAYVMMMIIICMLQSPLANWIAYLSKKITFFNKIWRFDTILRNGQYPEPLESSLHFHILLLKDQCEYDPYICEVSWSKFCVLLCIHCTYNSQFNDSDSVSVQIECLMLSWWISQFLTKYKMRRFLCFIILQIGGGTI